MPMNYIRRLTGHKRTADGNRHLGFALAFIAGATNAGGFLAVRQYTSHMTGIASSIADNVALGAYTLALAGVGAMLFFVLGAACSAIMVNYARRHEMHSEYALPLLLEALLLLCFGIMGARLSVVGGFFVPVTVMLLCFIMGLQNAVMTKLSRGEIRTTHITGMVTDIGIELGKLVYRNGDMAENKPKVVANRERLSVLSVLVLCFAWGGMTGAWGFKHVGYIVTVPIALFLVMLASVPAIDDLVSFARVLGRR